MSKLDMNMFAFVAWLGRNQHVHSEDGLTVNDGYEWYNYMWNMWLKNSDIGRKISNGEITTMGGSITVNNNPEIKWSVGNGDAVNSYNPFNTRANTTWTKMFNDNVLLDKNRVADGIPAPWDRNNTVNTEEQTPYIPTSTNTIHVNKPDKTDDGTIAVIEITIDIKQR
jgi:hypothetical protein